MSIDLARELTARCIAHNVARAYPIPEQENDAAVMADKLASLLEPDVERRQFLWEAATALWRVLVDGQEPDPIRVAISGGLQPEQGEVHD